MLKTWMVRYMTPGSSNVLPYSFLSLKTEKLCLWNRSLVMTAKFAWNNNFLYLHVHTHVSWNPWYSGTPPSTVLFPVIFPGQCELSEGIPSLGSSALQGPYPTHAAKQGTTTTHHEQPCLGVLSPAWVAWNPGCKNWYAHENIIW